MASGSQDTSKWNIIYPNYIDATKTTNEGRRIAKEKACDHPKCAEIMEVLQYLKIPSVPENKYYPRDWMVPGRVRVMLKAPTGEYVHPEIHTKMQVMLKLGELIPKLKSRAEGEVLPANHQLMQISTAALASSSAPAPGTGGKQAREARKEAKKAEKKANKQK